MWWNNDTSYAFGRLSFSVILSGAKNLILLRIWDEILRLTPQNDNDCVTRIMIFNSRRSGIPNQMNAIISGPVETRPNGQPDRIVLAGLSSGRTVSTGRVLNHSLRSGSGCKG